MSDLAISTGPLRGPLRRRESHLWERAAGDWYIEPKWIWERLFAVERFDGVIVDPACGLGTVIKAAHAAGFAAIGCDKIQRAPEFPAHDFMLSNWPDFWDAPNIVTNPPFALCNRLEIGKLNFVELCLERAARKVALLLPANWVQGQRRARWLAKQPLYRVYMVCPRPSMPPGHVIEAGLRPGNGTTDYCVTVFLRGYQGAPTLHWLHRDRCT
jgi:hypothetical protein